VPRSPLTFSVTRHPLPHPRASRLKTLNILPTASKSPPIRATLSVPILIWLLLLESPLLGRSTYIVIELLRFAVVGRSPGIIKD